MTVHVVGVAALDGQHHLAQLAAVDDVAELVKVLPYPAAFTWSWNLQKGDHECGVTTLLLTAEELLYGSSYFK